MISEKIGFAAIQSPDYIFSPALTHNLAERCRRNSQFEPAWIQRCWNCYDPRAMHGVMHYYYVGAGRNFRIRLVLN